MAAFDRVLSGIPEMDKAFDNIRLGDNVVWRVSELSQFKLFMEPYVEQAIKDKRNIIYFRFASHEPLVEDRPEIKTVEIPLSHRFETFTVDIHNVIEKEGLTEDKILLESKGSSMGMSKANELDIIVYVDPVKYYMPYNNKPAVARLIGKLNWHYRDLGKHMMLIVPGRVGTSSPELGVPTSFADISAFEIICETEETKAGYNPELSYGSHIFQDLVEAEILYTAVFSNSKKTMHFHPEKLLSSPDLIGEFYEDHDLSDIVHVFDVLGRDCKVYNDIANEHLVITC